MFSAESATAVMVYDFLKGFKMQFISFVAQITILNYINVQYLFPYLNKYIYSITKISWYRYCELSFHGRI